jgi:hypothetical protein
MKPIKVYVAGPMTHIPHFNIPAFEEAAATLRSRGYEVVSPVELDSAEMRAVGMASPDGDPAPYYGKLKDSWGNLLARDVRIITDEGIDAVYVLPGWERSRGARLETFVANAIHGLPVYSYPSRERVSEPSLLRAWVGLGYDEQVEVVTETIETTTVEERVLVEGSKPDAVGSVQVDAAGVMKGDGGKPRTDLLPPVPLLRIAEVLGYGARKYAPHNWRKGADWGRIYAALVRHLFAWLDGEDLDPETGMSHLAHAGCEMLFLLEITEKGIGTDDRWKG